MKITERYVFSRHIMLGILVFSLLCTLCACKKTPERTVNETEETTFGIDVARYQGTIDWQEVAASGIDFAMIRLGYRAMADGNIVPDSNARYNLQEASKAGIPVGAYFFSTAISKEEAMEEAAWTAEFVSRYPITYPIVYDCEGFTDPDSRQYHLTKTERTDIALAFLETIDQLGYEAMFYASKNDMQGQARWEVSRIEKNFKIWVAQYPEIPYPGTQASSYTGEHHMWQYSMEGSVPGISQPVDLDIAYFGYDGIEPPKNPEPPQEVGPDVSAMLTFQEVNEFVTAKDVTRLRNMPSQDEDSHVLFMLENGELAQRIAISNSGWSKLIYNGVICYAVSSYLTIDLTVPEETEDDGIQTQFMPVSDQVTAKVEVNLRKLPSVEHEDAVVIAKLKNGQVAQRIGISDNGWSRLKYNGVICYAVSSYLMPADPVPAATESGEYDVKTEFEEVNELVTAKDAVNLRTLPSTEHPDVKIVCQLLNGEVAVRTGINRDLGWSRVEYNGQVLYCVSSYLTEVE